ncbi:hypothetical protein [Edaphobacter bradus]|uniref:hypothetical protein n=1 Tax=Edaphobacter bradus TaxID=2259016 RepID=UPI0021E03BF8|nr:hypothetical protein [Edaphobacter bradus]
MTRIDIDLIVAIYAMYGYECVHWLKEEDIAFSRSLLGGWKEWKHTSLSFTLLRRLPCVSNPLPFVPGFVVLKQGSISDQVIGSTLSRLDRFSARYLRSLRVMVFAQSATMLVLVPAIIALQMLSFLWLPLLALIVTFHVAILCFFVRSLRSCERDGRRLLTDALPICLNPIAAIRSTDMLLQRLFFSLLARGAKFKCCVE